MAWGMITYPKFQDIAATLNPPHQTSNMIPSKVSLVKVILKHCLLSKRCAKKFEITSHANGSFFGQVSLIFELKRNCINC